MRHSCSRLNAAPVLSKLFLLLISLFFLTGKSYAQSVTFVLQPANQTPVLGGDVGFNATPAFADINGDGRLDCIAGNEDGKLQVFINQLVVNNLVFNPAIYNPFAGIDVGFNSAPAFVDIDGDGDLDCFIGSRAGTFTFLRRSGPTANPVFTLVTGANNPLNGLNSNGSGYSTPTFADVDGDGDFDCISGRKTGSFRYFRNDGTPTAPVFVAANFNNRDVNPSLYSTPDVVDLDKDGSLDLLAGGDNINGTNPMRLFPDLSNNNFAVDAPYGLSNPAIYAGSASFFAIAFADIDGDEDEDCIIGMRDGRFRFVENTSCNYRPNANCVHDFTVYLDEDGSIPVTVEDFNDQSTGGCFIIPSIVGLSIDIEHLDCMNIPKTTVVLTAQDVFNKRIDTCHVTVTVKDTLGPILRCIEEYNVYLGPNGEATIDFETLNASNFDDGSTDNCTANQDLQFEVSLVTTGSKKSSNTFTFNCEDAGYSDFQLELDAVDEHGNYSDEPCYIDIVVSDNLPPVNTAGALPALSVDLCTVGSLLLNNIRPATITDNCTAPGDISISVSPTDGAGHFPAAWNTPGQYLLTWTYLDENENESSQTQIINVVNNAPPVLNCPANVVDTYNNPSGPCGKNVTFPMPTSSDCDFNAASIVGSHTSGAFFPIGTTIVSFLAFDIAGHSAICNFTVTIQDQVAPTFYVNGGTIGNISVNAGTNQCGANVSWPWTVIANDFCEGARPVTASHNSGAFFPIGTTTVSYSATDSKGNAASTAFVVTVSDVQMPVITCPPNQTFFTQPGQCTTNVILAPPSATDNCAVAVSGPITTATPSPNAPGSYAFSSGSPTLVRFTATDASSNSVSCTFTVTVNDNEAPKWSNCPADITVPISGCSTNVSWAVPTVTDNCGVSTNTSNYSPNASFNEGATTVTYTAWDAKGNTATCSFNVRVTNTTPPSITCPANITVNNTSGVCTYNWPGTFPVLNTTVAPCDPGTIRYFLNGTNTQIAAGYGFPANMTTVVKATATDISGNSASCTFSVQVKDNQAPVLSCPANIVRPNTNNQCNANVSWTAPTFTDNCPGSVVLSTTNQSGSVFPKGTTTVTYIGTDGAGNTGFCAFTVTVNDAQPPTINNCPANITVNNTNTAACTTPVTWVAPTIIDNCSGSLALAQTNGPNSGSSFGVGNTLIRYQGTDAAGNTSVCSFTVTVVDKAPPVISNCPSSQEYFIISGNVCNYGPIGWNAPTANDACDGNISMVKTGPNPGTTFTVGSSNITYTATDSKGNTSTCSFTIKVSESVPPVINCTPSNITVNASGTACNAVINPATLTPPSATDNCGAPTVSVVSPNNAQTVNVNSSISVIWKATDASGNSAICSQLITVKDQTAPTANCHSSAGAPITVNASTLQPCLGISPNELFSSNQWVAPTVTDNCSEPTITLLSQPPAYYPIGISQLVYRASDGSGNTSSCSVYLRVVGFDNVPPSITCPNNVTVNANQGACFATNVALGNPNASDTGGCSNAVTVTSNAPTQYPLNVTLVTWKATDGGGNTAICVQSVTVNPNTEICGNQIDDDCDGQIDEGCSGGGNTDPCQVQLLATDGAIRDSFGFAGVLKDDVAAIGAPADDNIRGVNAGAVYLRYIDYGGAGVWGEFKKIIAGDGATSDMFGSSVDLDGDVLVVGAPQDDSKGSIYLYGRNVGGTNNWGQITKIASPGAIGDRFGYSVEIDGNFIVVGAPFRDLTAPVRTDAGAAYVYRFNGSSWVFNKELNASDALTADRFGSAVAISDDNIVVGAPLSDPASIASAGAAYVYRQDLGGANNWGQQKKLVATLDAASDEQFGYSVSISGSNIAVGDYRDSYLSFTRPGSVYMFSRDLGGANNWGTVKRVTPNDAFANDNFGFSVSVDGGDLLVGSRFDDDKGSNSGSAYHYGQNEGGANNWGPIEKILAGDGVLNDNFGQFVSYYNGVYLVGSVRDDIANNLDQGSAYILTDCGSAAKQAVSENRDTPVFENNAVRCFPNPFSDVINVDVNLDVDQNLIVTVTDATGRQVATLFNGLATPENRYQWNAGSFNGGMYFIRVESDSVRKVVPVVLIK
ncbi:MAG: HYR domain-containing protein [Bacteroidota bacterium]